MLELFAPFLFGPIQVVLLGRLVLGRNARAIAKGLSVLSGGALILAFGTLLLLDPSRSRGHSPDSFFVLLYGAMAGAGLIGSQLGLLLVDFLGARFPRTAGG